MSMMDHSHSECLEIGPQLHNSLVADKMILDPVGFTVFVDPLEGVGAKSMHMAKPIRSSSWGEGNQYLWKKKQGNNQSR
jgi:hypothetical protein